MMLCVVGCKVNGAASEGKPIFLFSINNMKTFLEEGKRAAEGLGPSSGTEVDKVIIAFKTPMEKMGYSYDKTINLLLKKDKVELSKNVPNTPEGGMFLQVLALGLDAIIKNPDESLKKGLISKETFDLLNKK